MKRTYVKHTKKVALPAPAAAEPVKERHVYLAWSKLNDDQRLQWSSYRSKRGVVVETKHAKGTAVRFNDDPEPIWLAGRLLTGAPEFD